MNWIISKLWEARSRLYRRRFLQPNTNFSAFFEIYKIYNPLHRSDLNFSKKRVTILVILNNYSFRISQNFVWKRYFLSRLWWNFVGISRTGPKISEVVNILGNCAKFWENSVKFSRFFKLFSILFSLFICLLTRARRCNGPSRRRWSWRLARPR